MSIVAQATQIHPEIPAPHWATDRYFDEDERQIGDEHGYSDGRFDVELSRLTTIRDAGYTMYDENVDVRWLTHWKTENIHERAYFTVLPGDIPELIAVLQRAHDRMQDNSRTLRRNPDATTELMERDA